MTLRGHYGVIGVKFKSIYISRQFVLPSLYKFIEHYQKVSLKYVFVKCSLIRFVQDYEISIDFYLRFYYTIFRIKRSKYSEVFKILLA